MQETELISENELNEKIKWLFRENVRITAELKKIEDERSLIEIQKSILQKQQKNNMLLKKQLENQKSLFDRQWQLLEMETRKLVCDQQQFENQKLKYRDKVYREARKNLPVATETKMFFQGVGDGRSLKKRYKDLLKIYHPDNMNGDNSLIQAINTEYDSLKGIYK